MSTLRFAILILAGWNATSHCLEADEPAKLSAPDIVDRGHSSDVLALAFLAEGEQIVSVSSKEVRFWKVANGEEIEHFELAGGEVAAIGSNFPDGPRLAFANFVDNRRDLGVGLFTAVDGRRVTTIEPNAGFDRGFPFRPRVGAIAFSPDGNSLATAGSLAKVGGPHGLPGGLIKTWDVRTGREIRRFGERPLWDKNSLDKRPLPSGEVLPGVSTSSYAGAVTWSDDGTLLAAGTDGAGGELPEAGEVWIWNVEDGKAVRSIGVRDEIRQGDFHSSVTALAISPENKWIAAVVGLRAPRGDGLILPAGPDAVIRLWEVETGRHVRDLQSHRGTVKCVAFSPDGQWLASGGSDGSVRLWNTASGQIGLRCAFPAPLIETLAFSPDGRRLAAGAGVPKRGGEVRVWVLPEQ